MVQEFVDGRSLQQVLAVERKLDPLRAIELTIQLLDALDEAHAHGVVHRDIKPGNIMLTRGRGGREELRVLDFGIAKTLHEDDERLTATGLVLGTPKYMAPEQIRQREIGPCTDVYAVGVLLYCLIAGRPPFVGEAQYDIIRQHMEAPVPALPEDVFGLDPLIARAMAKSPEDRFATAGEMRDALAAALGPATEVTSAGPFAADGAARRPSGRRGIWTGLLIALCLGVGGLVVALDGADSTDDDPADAQPATPADATLARATLDATAGDSIDASAPDPDSQPDIARDAGPADVEQIDPAPRPKPTRRRKSSDAERAGPPRPAETKPKTPREPPPAKAPGPAGESADRRPAKRVRPPAPDPSIEQARAAILESLDRCHCNYALNAIRGLEAKAPSVARRLRTRHTEECELDMPGVENCFYLEQKRIREEDSR